MTTQDLAERMNREAGGYDRAMGLHFLKATADEVIAEIVVGDVHRQIVGLVHGGVYAGMVETVCSVGALAVALPRDQSIVGVENHTSFLRAVRSGTLRARATPLATGRRMQLWEAAITDEQARLVATGRVRLFCSDAEAPGAAPDGTRG